MFLFNKYEDVTDENLIAKLQEGDLEIMDYLLNKYKGLVKKKARAMFLIGGDTDDLIQEGMIGLYKAIRDFNIEKEASFYTFADKCISRQIYTAINTSNRKKHAPLNSYISFYSVDMNADYDTISLLSETHSESDKNPEELFIDKENVKLIEEEINRNLSTFERQVLKLYIDGSGYIEISELLNKPPKSIDNAIQRIKGKVTDIVQILRKE